MKINLDKNLIYQILLSYGSFINTNIYFKCKEFEAFSISYSKATSLSYTAGVADLDSVNNFSKDEVNEVNRDEDSNLQQTKSAITDAKMNLDCIIKLLQKSYNIEKGNEKMP